MEFTWKRLSGEGRGYFLSVAFRGDLSPNPADLAFLVEEEGCALHAHIGPPVHRLLAPHPARLRQLMLGIGEEGEVEVELCDELRVGLGVVRADADHPR